MIVLNPNEKNIFYYKIIGKKILNKNSEQKNSEKIHKNPE